jgi:hypothetical protein
MQIHFLSSFLFFIQFSHTSNQYNIKKEYSVLLTFHGVQKNISHVVKYFSLLYKAYNRSREYLNQLGVPPFLLLKNKKGLQVITF